MFQCLRICACKTDHALISEKSTLRLRHVKRRRLFCGGSVSCVSSSRTGEGAFSPWQGNKLTRPLLSAIEKPRCRRFYGMFGVFMSEPVSRGPQDGGKLPLSAAVICIMKGARIVRMHDVAAAVAATRMTEAVLGFRAPAYTRHNMR